VVIFFKFNMFDQDVCYLQSFGS